MTTRTLMADLRARMGHAAPLAPAAEARPIPAPPSRVFPTEHQRSGFAAEAARHTTALVGIGHVGGRYATRVVLQFQAELAVAHDAVGSVLPPDWAESNGLLPLKSQVEDHAEYLLRPDRGRRLDNDSKTLLMRNAASGVDVQPILADGLSARACMESGLELLTAFTRECEALGMTVGTPICAQFARVWLQDEIGETVRARVAAILLGERPGLGTGDGLSAYLVFDPKVGRTDGDRNMMSNIHARGTPPPQAARRLALLAQAMIRQNNSGVDLDLAGLGELAEESRGYRAPQVREQLVETEVRS